MAAEFATPEKVAFFLAHTSGLDLRAAHPRAPRRARAAAHGLAQHRVAAHRVHGDGRLPPRHDDGHLGGGPGGDDPVAHQPRHQASRPRPARAHPPAALSARRGPQACRPHRGDGRSRPDGGLLPRRTALRDRHRGQAADGPPARAGAVRRGRTASSSSRSQTSSATGAAGRSSSNGSQPPGSRPSSASSPPTASSRCSTVSSTSPSWPATCPPTRACSSGCTASA